MKISFKPRVVMLEDRTVMSSVHLPSVTDLVIEPAAPAEVKYFTITLTNARVVDASPYVP